MDNKETNWAVLLAAIAEYIPTPAKQSEPDCALCGDAGYIRHTIDGYTYAEKCKCRIAKEASLRIRQSGLGRIIEEWTLDAFKATNPYQQRMKRVAVDYLDAVRMGGKPWLYFGGAVGSGKSHLCTAVCGELIHDGRNVRYFQWLTESRKLKGYAADPDEYQELVQKYIDTEILYIDDLFKSKRNESSWLNPSDADIRLAFEIINQRYYENKITIISAEWLLVDDLLPVDEGTFSRVYEKTKGYRVEVKREPGRNYRMQEARKYVDSE